MTLLDIKADPEPYEALHAAADAADPKLRRVFREAVEGLRDATDPDALAAALTAGLGDAALDWGVFAVGLQAMQPILLTVLVAGADVALDAAPLAAIPEAARVALAFDLTNPAAVAWTQQHGAELVRGISDRSREGIRRILVEAFEDGLTADEQARRIRELIGLTDRQAAQLENYRRTLDDLTDDERETLVGRLYRRLIRDRAETIARTESIAAASAGQDLLWQEAVLRGDLLAGEWERFWITTPDDRLCPICLPLDGQRAAIGGVFPSGVANPPQHPRCRCAQAVRRVRT